MQFSITLKIFINFLASSVFMAELYKIVVSNEGVKLQKSKRIL